MTICAFLVASLLGLNASVAPAAEGAAEVPPAASLPCFPGAYYRKAVSSQDVWTGIEVTVTLPEFRPDPNRIREDGRTLDNASIYIGGRAGQEIDAGLNWEIVRLPDGSVSTTGMAYRPFWRNDQWFSGPARPEYYFFPGDTIRMRVEAPRADELEMEIALVERGPNAAAALAEMGFDLAALETPPLRVSFEARGFGPGQTQEFKRVNAIDQRGREGRAVEPTAASVIGLVWREAWLLRGEERRPFGPERFTDMRCPEPQFFTVSTPPDAAPGAEAVDISGPLAGRR